MTPPVEPQDRPEDTRAPGPRVAFVFPGQGSQKTGMGRDWADAFPVCRATFEEADRVLGFALSRLCWEGPEEELQATANTQPALLTVSVAVDRALAERGLGPAMVAGHSLGEYSALVAAGALPFADALTLVRRRGEVMQEAVPRGEGKMAAVMHLAPDEVAAAAADAARETGTVCTVANYNSPLQTVVAGAAAGVDRAMELASERGARKVTELAVSAPFHCPLMAPAREAMEPLLAEAPFADPKVPVVTNVDAEPATGAEACRRALVRQIDSPVRWSGSVERMAAMGATAFLEVGAGKVLTGLVRRITREVPAIALAGPEELDAALAAVRDHGGDEGGEGKE